MSFTYWRLVPLLALVLGLALYLWHPNPKLQRFGWVLSLVVVVWALVFMNGLWRRWL